MIVKCVFDNYETCKSEIVKAILMVGDLDCLPKKGQLYEVVGHYCDTDPETGKVRNAYLLSGEGLESSINYGAQLVFNKEWFEIVDQTFVPNSVDEDGRLVRVLPYFYKSIEFNENYNMKFYE